MMEKLIIGIICTVISPIVTIRNYREIRKYNEGFREKRRYSNKCNYYDGPAKGQIILSVISFILGLALLIEYFSGG
jgi:hypothetical protein